MKKQLLLYVFVLSISFAALFYYVGHYESFLDMKIAKSDDYPTKPITMILPFSNESNTDIGARILVPQVEKELGVKINITYELGEGGWKGWAKLIQSENDGYTIGYINTPTFVAGYLGAANRRDQSFRDLDLIINHVLDYGAIAVRADDPRFKSIHDLVEYAKINDVTTTSTGINSDDHIAVIKFNKKFGTKFVPVHMDSRIQGYDTALKGYIDVFFDNVGALSVGQRKGEVRVLAVMSPERSEFLPEVPTLDESGYKGIYSWSARGIAAPKGLDPKRLDKLVNAFYRAMSDSEHISKMSQSGYQVKILTGREYEDFIQADEDAMKAIDEVTGLENK